MTKIGRNELCPCGKLKSNGTRLKYKHCCGGINSPSQSPLRTSIAEVADRHLQRHKASELVRTQQQGLGKPIIGVESNGYQLIAVKNKLHWGKWKTFPDFLQNYIKDLLGPEWGNAELSKPLKERHPIIQWYNAYCAHQKIYMNEEKEVNSSPITGVVACYLMLAYNLYLISHNVELERRLVARLKNVQNFQGAYYELMVASVLIRAGFELQLIDESNRDSKNCEFTALSKSTGKTYWIEAKMKAVSGLLGKTEISGSNDNNPLSKLINHLSDAIAKPAIGERMVFIDLNAQIPNNFSEKIPPSFMTSAIGKMKRYSETNMPPGEKAYVFLTSTSFHRELHKTAKLIAMPYGLAIPDFNTNQPMLVTERYRQDKRHIDAISVLTSLNNYLDVPATFDGSMSSEKFGSEERIQIGSTYAFERPEGQIIGTITSAHVVEEEKKTIIGMTTPEGKKLIGEIGMTEEQLADYRNHKDTYFGLVRRAPRELSSPMELFEFLMDGCKKASRQQMLDWFGPHRDKKLLDGMSDEDLLIEYCGAMVNSVMARKQKSSDI